MSTKILSPEQSAELLATLQQRFNKHPERHPGISWDAVQAKLETNPEKLWVLDEMELSGGEPDVIVFGTEAKDEFTFVDCAADSPKGRRSFCYDRAALNARKEHKPANDVLTAAAEMGVELLTEEQYRYLQTLGKFDLKTSSWVTTPANIRKLGGAIFCDRRYDTVFTYHNGAESYYGGRAFRGLLKV